MEQWVALPRDSSVAGPSGALEEPPGETRPPRGAGSCGRASQAPSGQLYTSMLDLRSSLLWGILLYVGGCSPPQLWRHFLS